VVGEILWAGRRGSSGLGLLEFGCIAFFEHRNKSEGLMQTTKAPRIRTEWCWPISMTHVRLPQGHGQDTWRKRPSVTSPRWCRGRGGSRVTMGCTDREVIL